MEDFDSKRTAGAGEERLNQTTGRSPQPASDTTDATQRVYIDGAGIPTATPRSTGSVSTGRSAAPQQRTASAQRARAAAAAKKKRERITLISLCVTAAVLLIAVIVVISVTLFNSPADDGLILKNVFAAGVNIGGMTKEQAKAALEESNNEYYRKLDMTVQVLDTTILLSSKDTGANLDVNGIVEAAYNYGRTGSRAEQERAKNQALTSSYTVPLDAYLRVDTTYIKSALKSLGNQYNTTLKQTTYEVQGQRPGEPGEEVDVNTAFQTLYIYMGTAEYGLNTDKLYEQIMDAYKTRIFQVTHECSVLAPKELDLEALYQQLCTAPVNATIDPVTYEVTPEVYGYGFTLEALKAAVDNASYGDTITLSLKFLAPDITSDIISGDLFKDILATYGTKISADANWNINLALACQLLNGTILQPNEEFSFNELLGELTEEKGYVSVPVFVGKKFQGTIGGGVCQVASTLYNCVLLADLSVLEQHNHNYVTDFIGAGFDVEVEYGNLDFRFANNTALPIKIEAIIENDSLQVTLVGTDTRDYTVEILFEETKTLTPGTVYNTMLPNNPGGYKEGDILVEAIPGCNVTVYRCSYTKDTYTLISKDVLTESVYAKRDAVLVKIYIEPPVEDPVDPSVPDDPIGTPDDTPQNPDDTPQNPDDTPQNPDNTPQNPDNGDSSNSGESNDPLTP